MVQARVTLSLSFIILLSGLGLADETADDSIPGIKLGAKAPDFRLKDQTGRIRQLSDCWDI